MSLWSALPRLDWKRRARLCARNLHSTTWYLGERVQFGSSQKEHRQTLGFDDEDVKTIAVDVGIPLGKV